MALYMSDSREWREEKVQAREDTEEFTRFTPLDRFLHALVIFSFLLLVTTGMPLKFYYTDWAKVLLAPWVARRLRRFSTGSGPSSPSSTSRFT